MDNINLYKSQKGFWHLKNLISLYNLHEIEEEYYCTIAKSQMTIYFFWYHLTDTTKGLQFLFLWENLDHQRIIGFSQKKRHDLLFSHSYCWCGKLACDVIAGIFLINYKMCESNQIQLIYCFPFIDQQFFIFSAFYRMEIYVTHNLSDSSNATFSRCI